VYLQDLNLATSDFLNAIRPYTRLIVGQIASTVPHQAKLSSLDIVFSSFPHFVERFRSQGLTAYYQPLAFSAQVLDALPSFSRDIPVSFVGGISPAHAEGLKFLEHLASNVNIGFWGYGRESLSLNSPILPQHHGEAWGLDMFGLLKRSLITVNRHIDVAEHNANNMRLFEATGCGALLITDYKDNLSDLFEIGREVVAYRDPEECVTMIHYYLAHPDEAATIAAAGQARTLRDHSYNGNMKQTTQILARHLRYQNESNSFTATEMAGVASVKIGIESVEVTDYLRSGWKNENIPHRQRALVQHELSEMYAGRAPRVFQIAAAAMYSLLDTGDSVLEVGCASGYYSEVLEYLLNIKMDYIGVDYSAALIAQAKDYYPNFRFEIADATSLPFLDKSIKVVFSSAVMMHIENYQSHLDELMRVASEYIVLHRTPVFLDQSTKFFTKKAYGVDVVELCFSQVELIEKFISARWKMIAAFELAANPVLGENEMTYVFARN
jgi:SAM-dependent methyltransferase